MMQIVCVRNVPRHPSLKYRTQRNRCLEDGTRLEIVDKFCYLADMIGPARGAEYASRTCIRCGWKNKQFNVMHGHKGATFYAGCPS